MKYLFTAVLPSRSPPCYLYLVPTHRHDGSSTGMAQGTHAKVGQFVLHLLKAFYWSHAAILYDDVTRSPNAEKRRCYFTAEGIFHALFQHFGWRPYNKRFDERSPRVDYVELLRGSSSRARGKQVELVLHSTSQAGVGLFG